MVWLIARLRRLQDLTKNRLLYNHDTPASVQPCRSSHPGFDVLVRSEVGYQTQHSTCNQYRPYPCFIVNLLSHLRGTTCKNWNWTQPFSLIKEKCAKTRWPPWSMACHVQMQILMGGGAGRCTRATKPVISLERFRTLEDYKISLRASSLLHHPFAFTFGYPTIADLTAYVTYICKQCGGNHICSVYPLLH
jgi:hypothetical protein